ncbi:MAG: 4-hydroxy-tetrahydrodipicolinate reductase [Chloroflexi bacterium]|nr:4-hydroxy-tetrahydrodipicolinate reductase [Chloroflexota bacterium]
MTDITVAVNGVLGRMGSTVLNAVEQEPGMVPVGGADALAGGEKSVSTLGGMDLPLASNLDILFGKVTPDVVVDFTNAEGGSAAMRACVAHKVRCVSGSTGMTPEELSAIGDLATEANVGVISASNFALGCVVLIHLARIASSYFDYADVIESHHEMKIDAPSGTAISIVQAMLEGKGGDFDQNIVEKELLSGTRGGSSGGINVHSARMPGRVARHEVVFGALGQTLTLLHDSISRDSFMPGVMLAVRRVMDEKSMIVGLDKVLGFSD